jgi:hypothetical protein
MIAAADRLGNDRSRIARRKESNQPIVHPEALKPRSLAFANPSRQAGYGNRDSFGIRQTRRRPVSGMDFPQWRL